MSLSRTPGIHPVQNTSTVLIANNSVFEKGRVILETDTNRIKTGDGVSTYTQLTYVEWNYEIVEAAGTDTYTGNFSKPFFLTYFPMMRVRVRFANANTGAATLNLNGEGAIPIKKTVSAALVTGDFLAGGIYELVYDGTNFQVLGSTSSGSAIPTIFQVLTAGNNATNLGILNLGNIVNTFGTRTLTIFQDSGNVQFWQPYLRDSSNGDTASVLIDISTPNSPYAELFASDGTKITQIRAAIDQVDIFGSPGTFKGALYSADYSANYTTRSLVDKAYVDARVPSTILTTRGDIIARDASAPVRLGLGASGTILRSNGTDLVYSTNTYPNTTPVGQILYATAANVIGGATDFLRLTTGELLLGTTALGLAEIFNATRNQNSGTYNTMINTTSGTAAYTATWWSSNAGTLSPSLFAGLFSAGYTSTGIYVASSATVHTNGTTPILIGTRGAAHLSLWTNLVERGRILSTGEFLIGRTAVGAISEWFGFQKDQNASTYLLVRNATSGTGGRASVVISGSSADGTGLYVASHSALYTTAGIAVASSSLVASNETGGLNMGTTSNAQASIWSNNLKRLIVSAAGSVAIGNGTAALATNVTDGFLYIPTCAGTPTGVPTAITGTVAMIFDTTNNKLYIYDGSWLGGTTPGAFT